MHAQPEPDAEQDTARLRFRMISVWDVSETDVWTTPKARQAQADDEAEQAAQTHSPFQLLRHSLLTQLERAGYTIVLDRATIPVSFDHDAKRAYIGQNATERETLTELASAVAEAATRVAREILTP